MKLMQDDISYADIFKPVDGRVFEVDSPAENISYSDIFMSDKKASPDYSEAASVFAKKRLARKGVFDKEKDSFIGDS